MLCENKAAPLELEEFSAGSAQASVKPQVAATPAAVLTIHRYCRNIKCTPFSISFIKYVVKVLISCNKQNNEISAGKKFFFAFFFFQCT